MQEVIRARNRRSPTRRDGHQERSETMSEGITYSKCRNESGGMKSNTYTFGYHRHDFPIQSVGMAMQENRTGDKI